MPEQINPNKVQERLVQLKLSNPKQYSLLEKSLNSSDPFIKNKTLTEFKENPLGYLDKYQYAPKKQEPKIAVSNKPNYVDQYLKEPEAVKPLNVPLNKFGQPLVPKVENIPSGVDPYSFKTEQNQLKSFKDNIQSFYLKDGNDDQKLTAIEKLKVLADKNPDIKNSNAFKQVKDDVISYQRKKIPELANVGLFMENLQTNPNEYQKLIKMGLEHSKTEYGSAAFGIENGKKYSEDIDEIINHNDYNKSLNTKSGRTYNPMEVKTIKANFALMGKQLVSLSYGHQLRTEVAEKLKPYQEQLKSQEQTLINAKSQLDILGKDKSKEGIVKYNNKVKEVNGLVNELKKTVTVFNMVDESIKRGQGLLTDLYKRKSYEEKNLELYNDEFVSKPLLNLKGGDGNNSNLKFNDLNNTEKRAVSFVENIGKKFIKSIRGTFASDYQLSIDSMNPDIQEINWHTGEYDIQGNPVMSNQMTYKKSDGTTGWNIGAVVEEGTFQTLNMLGTGKLTGLMAGAVAKTANLGKSIATAVNTGSKFKYIPSYSSKNILDVGINLPKMPLAIKNTKVGGAIANLAGDKLLLGARALTYPAVYSTVYGRTYADNINKFQSKEELKDYARKSSMIESLTESIVPDVFFFNNMGVSAIGKKLGTNEYKRLLGFVRDGATAESRKNLFKTLMRTSGKVTFNTLQEALVEEGINYFAMSKYEDIKEEDDATYRRQEDKATWEGAVDMGKESLATMSLSMLMGVKGHYKQYSDRYNYDFNNPESLSYHRYNVAINGDLLRESLISDKSIKGEQKVKMLELISKNENLFKKALNSTIIPDKKTLGKDEESTFIYFNALSKKEELEQKQIKNGLSAQDKKKYEDLDTLLKDLDSKNNDWAQLTPEQREKKTWQWFREGITETRENDTLEDSVSTNLAHLDAHKAKIEEVYEKRQIDKKTYDKYQKNFKQAEEKIFNDSAAKVSKNLSRINELTEDQLLTLRDDILLDKAIANDNFTGWRKVKDLTLEPMPVVSVQQLEDYLVPGTKATVTYKDEKDTEFTGEIENQEGVLIDLKTGKEIKNTFTITSAELFEETIKEGANFVANEESLKTRLETVERVFTEKKNERLDLEKQLLKDKFNAELTAAEQWAKDTYKSFVEKNEALDFDTWKDLVSEYVATIPNKEVANLLEERLLTKGADIMSGVEDQQVVPEVKQETQVADNQESKTNDEINDYIDSLVSPITIQEELKKQKELLAKETKPSITFRIKQRIKKLEDKLVSTDVVDINFVRDNITEKDGKFYITVTLNNKKITLLSPVESKEESITFFNNLIAEGNQTEIDKYVVKENNTLQEAFAAMQQETNGTWVLFDIIGKKYVRAYDAFNNVFITDKQEAFDNILDFIQNEKNILLSMVESKSSNWEEAQKTLDKIYVDEVDLKPETTTVKTEEAPVDTIQSEIEAKKADIERRRQEELEPITKEIEKVEKEIEKVEKDDKTQGAYDFSASSNSGKWNSANNELHSLVQNHRKAFSIYKLLIGDVQSFKELVDIINEKTDANIEYTERMKRADETMSAEEIQSAIDSYNNSSTEKQGDKAQVEKDILLENNLQDEIEYTAQELIDKFPLTGVQKIIWNLIKDIVNKLGIKVKFSSNRITEGFDGSNNPQNGEILIRPSTLKTGRFGEVLVHEIVHALTTKIISRVNSGVTTGLTQKQINAVRGLMKLYQAVKADNNLENKYPVKDVFEFIAHLTNEEFVKELESKDKNFIQKVVDFILDVLGVNNANELSKKYLQDIISDGVFLQEQGITVLPTDYANNIQGSKNDTKLQQLKDKLQELKGQVSKINAKYDAELKALEQSVGLETNTKALDLNKRSQSSIDTIKGFEKILNEGLFTIENSNHIVKLDINGNLVNHGYKNKDNIYVPNEQATLTDKEIENVKKQYNLIKIQLDFLNRDYIINLEKLYNLIGRTNLESFLETFPRENRGVLNLINITSYLLNNATKLENISEQINAKYNEEIKALEKSPKTNQVDLKEERRKELILEEYKPKNVIGYMSIPNRNGSFNSANISKSPNESSSFYQIEDLGNGQIALTFFNNLRAVQDASSAPEITLKSIMNPKDALNQNTKKITTTKPAIFKKEDDKYVLVSKGEIYYSEPIKSKSEIEKINAKYDALEKENNQESTIDKVPFNIVSLYKDLIKSGVIRYTDENENPC